MQRADVVFKTKAQEWQSQPLIDRGKAPLSRVSCGIRKRVHAHSREQLQIFSPFTILSSHS